MQTLGFILVAVVAASAALVLYAWLRPNRAEVDPALQLTSAPIVADGTHNSNTDMIAWRGGFLLVHAASPWHLGSVNSRLLVSIRRTATSGKRSLRSRPRASTFATRRS